MGGSSITMKRKRWLMMILVSLSWDLISGSEEEDERLPNKCEVCKLLTLELQSVLDKSSRSKAVLELGQVLDSGTRKKKIKYNTSETRLADALENICDRMLEYNVHAERQGSLRYAKGQSETMTTLKNLRDKGVKVDLGIPGELWDEPSVEVSTMKKQCEKMLEEYEEVVEDWYFSHQDKGLQTFLCEDHVLHHADRDCLSEMWPGKKGDAGHRTEEETDVTKIKPSQSNSMDTSHQERGSLSGEL